VVLTVAFVAGVALCWILLVPPGGGPDESSHLVRSGAVARGDLQGRDLGNSLEGFELPDSYLLPDAACYAIIHPDVPVACAAIPVRSGTTIELATTADEYPIWGHLPVGLASRLPGPDPIWWARIAGGAVAALLVGWSLCVVGTGRSVVRAGVLLATTPMAWFTFAVVNPSSMAISGAIALWVGLLFAADARPSSHAGWLTACGWVALALPRRDGLIWACIALVVAGRATGQTTRSMWRALPVTARLLIALSTVATVVWGLTNDSRVSKMVAFAPLIVVAAEVIRSQWDRAATSVIRRRGIGAIALSGSALAGLAVAGGRPGGWDSDLTQRIVGETGYHLIEAVGVLGWLDTSLPELALAAWFVALGVLAASSVFDSFVHIRLAAFLVSIAIITSWAFELFNGDTSGTYWQGRYSLPLLVGVPMLLARSPMRGDVDRRVGRTVGITALAVMNVAAWSTARRFGVGTSGSLAPWDWDTPFAPIYPLIVLVVLAALSAGLAAILFRDDSATAAASAG
jgi:hypothetical protein